MKDFDPKMLVVTLTIEQFFSIQKEVLISHQEMIKNETKKMMLEFLESEVPVQKAEKKYVYGLKGLAKLLDCSRTKAFKVKASGLLDDAIYQNGRLIKIDVELAKDLFYKSLNKDEQ